MELNIKKVIPGLIQAVICIIILFIPFYIMYRSGNINYPHYYGYFIRTGILMILFYVNYLFLIDKFLFNKKFALYIVMNILFIGILFACQHLIMEALFSPHVPKHPDRPAPPAHMRIWGDMMFIVLTIGLSVALKATARWYRDSINLEKIKAARLEADLRNLRNQLNPHFLFNTLNNIYSLIATDSEKARESVYRLSKLLRHILYDNDKQFIPVEKEIEFTQNYIDLMKMRLDPKVILNVSIENNAPRSPIAPLLFITLIENAFKHGINNEGDSYIDIRIKTEQNEIECIVENSLDQTTGEIEIRNSGIGLTNLSQRLELLYPDRHQLSFGKEKSGFRALLKINCTFPLSEST